MLRPVTSILSSKISNTRNTICRTIHFGSSTRRTLLVLLSSTSKKATASRLVPFELPSECKAFRSRQGVRPKCQNHSLRLFKRQTLPNGLNLRSMNTLTPKEYLGLVRLVISCAQTSLKLLEAHATLASLDLLILHHLWLEILLGISPIW
jgi:hypothetical protein